MRRVSHNIAWYVCRVYVGEDRRVWTPTPGVQPSYPRPISLPPRPLFSLFFSRVPPTPNSDLPLAHLTPARPFFVKSPLTPTPGPPRPLSSATCMYAVGCNYPSMPLLRWFYYLLTKQWQISCVCVCAHSATHGQVYLNRHSTRTNHLIMASDTNHDTPPPLPHPYITLSRRIIRVCLCSQGFASWRRFICLSLLVLLFLVLNGVALRVQCYYH